MFDLPLISRCLNPSRIPDVFHGGYMYVPCGHCAACRDSYRSSWQNRIRLECKSSVSVLFFTLTYSNSCAPLLTFSDDGLSLISNRSSDDNIDLSHWLDSFNFPSLQTSRYNYDKYSFTYNFKPDVQKFLKRLRRRLDYDKKALLNGVSKSARQFRYFICSEYGPQTFRAHYHGLLFFSDKRTSKAVQEFYLRDSWKLCLSSNIDVSEVNSNAPSYVAKYVSCDSRVPSVLTLPQTRTFHLASRHPAIGCLSVGFPDFAVKIEHHNITYNQILNTKDNGLQSISLPFPRSVISYFFPKPFEFNRMDYDDLFSFYSLGFKHLKDLLSLNHSLVRFYRIGEPNPYNSGIPFTFGYVSSQMSDFERLGIPQNMLAIRRAYKFIHESHITLVQYINLFLSCYLIRFSSSYEQQCKFIDFCVNRGLSWNCIAYICSPDIVNSLPLSYSSLTDDQRIYIDLHLSSYNCSCDDFYLADNRLDLSLFDIRMQSFFNEFLDYLSQSAIDFDKTRNINHIKNCSNYESF